MILQYLTDTLDYILSLDSQAALRVFWYFIIFDLPRYLLTDFYILFRDLLGRLNVQEGSAFLRRLREDPPLVSVVVPVLNEEKTIAWTVKSLREQSYRRLQIIIVDDGSTDATPTICQRLADNKTVYYTRFAERAGKSAVLNHGLRLARGEYVIFVDSDTTFDTDAIFNVIKQFADPAVGGVAGNLMVRNGSRNLLTQLQEIEYIFTISIGRRIRALFGILPIISGAFGAFRRDLISLETMGGHEPGPGNDSDLAIRLRKKGYK
ncbi:MAG: glycosyltransferase family 2 protein, partial [Calditrichaeota bacterium]